MNPTFTETQKFNKWWMYLLFSIPFLVTSISYVLVQFGIVEPNGGEKSPPEIILILIFSLLILIWGISVRLKTTINKNGISACFIGIPFCNKNFTWAEIQSSHVIEYSPIKDYGGWGVRMGFNGWCYNVSGKIGIKLTRTNGKPFLIGTQQKEEAEKIINHYFKK